jgi:PAS domain S-box-containing protein
VTHLSFDYQKLFRTLPTRFIVFAANDPTFTIVEESDAHARMVDMARTDVIGRPLFEVFPDASEKYKKTGVSDLAESLRKVIKTKQPDTMAAFRYDIKAADGTFNERHWRVTHYPVMSEDGKKVELIFQATNDITQERQAGAQLKRVEEQLAEALSIGSIGTWTWDIKHNRIIGDKNLAYMFGISEERAAKGLELTAFIDAIHAADRPWVKKAITKTVKEKGAFEEEYRTIGRDGSMRWVIARGRVEADTKGEPLFFPGVLVDITERKLAEKNLRFMAQASATLASSLNYKKTLQTIAKMVVPDIADWCGVDIVNKNTGVLEQVAIAHKDQAKIRWAKELRKKYPLHIDDPTGSAEVIRSGNAEFYPVVTPELITASSRDKEQLKILKEVGINSVIIVPLKVNDKAIGSLSLVLNEQGRHYSHSDFEMAEELANRASLAMTNAFLYENAQDEIVKRRQLEDDLRQANEKLESRVRERTAQLEATNASLEQSNRELEDFAYVASHDLQEPLRKIQAFGNLLDSEYAERLGDGRDYLLRMRNAASRMSTLIEDLLQFSRVTTKARDFVKVDLDKIAREVLGDLETRVQDTAGIVTIGPMPAIQADPTQMRQLLQNLIGNALKFHKEKEAPVVTVNARIVQQTEGPPLCTIRVQDNGVGFDEKYLDRIFSVFQRLHSRDHYEGTGIGLAVCRKIAERHGGTITATSKPGEGSIFIVTLPVRHKKGKETL